MSLRDFRLEILEELLDLTWSQWTAMGVSGNAPTAGNRVLDPEALVLFTCEAGRYDPRIFDSMVEWLEVNQRFVNIQRLRTLSGREGLTGGNLLAALAHLFMKPSNRSKWERMGGRSPGSQDSREPLFLLKDGTPHPQLGRSDEAFGKAGYLRSSYIKRGAAVRFSAECPANLILKLRALFGVGSRCEIIAWLLTHDEGNPTTIAADTGYSSKAVYNAVTEMYGSGTLRLRRKGRESLYRLRTEEWEPLLLSGRPAPSWMDWPGVFGALNMIWTAVDKPWLARESEEAAAGEMKLALGQALPLLQDADAGSLGNLQTRAQLARMSLSELCAAIKGIAGYFRE
jgi:hypothetical protein